MAMDRVKQKKYKTTDKDEEIHKPNGNRQLKRNEKNKRFMRSFFSSVLLFNVKDTYALSTLRRQH